MISQKLFRHIYCKRSSLLNLKCISQSYSKDSSSSSSSSDDEKDKKKIKQRKEVKVEQQEKAKVEQSKKSEEALRKLNVLLQKMVEEDKEQPLKSALNLAKPKSRLREKKESEKQPEDIVTAAKNVADSLGGDKQIESELLSKLLGVSITKDSTEAEKKPLNLSEVLVGMKIDRTAPPTSGEEVSKAQRVRNILSNENITTKDGKLKALSRIRKTRFTYNSEIEKIDLFGGEPIGIFTKESFKPVPKQVELKTWNKLMERELQFTITHPPENYFQEMILWTKQGKLWKFPIDNEQGMEEEQNVSFTEHIFLEKYLEPWCPSKGPIRHFMELVCVGLSKNPYLTVQAKRDHIEWFKNYFASKLELLTEVGAIPSDFKGLKQLNS